LPEAFVIGGIRLGEKQEQSKNKIALNGKIHVRDGAGAPSLNHRAIRRGRRRHRERSDAIQGNVGSPTIPGLLRRHEGVEGRAYLSRPYGSSQ
jgi:hypothetical protein